MGFIGRSILGLIDRLWFVISLFAGVQWTGYLQAYMHQLTGHLQEAIKWMNEYRAIATKHHHSFDTLVNSLTNSKDPSLIEQGNLLQEHMLREGQLQQSLEALQGAEIWQQPIYFVKYLQSDIAMQTATDYIPTLPLSLDALVYALAGVAILWLPLKILFMPFTKKKTPKYGRT